MPWLIFGIASAASAVLSGVVAYRLTIWLRTGWFLHVLMGVIGATFSLQALFLAAPADYHQHPSRLSFFLGWPLVCGNLTGHDQAQKRLTAREQETR